MMLCTRVDTGYTAPTPKNGAARSGVSAPAPGLTINLDEQAMALNKDTGGFRPALDELSANSLHRLSTQARKAAAIRAYNDALRIRDPRQQLHARFAALMELAKARGG